MLFSAFFAFVLAMTMTICAIKRMMFERRDLDRLESDVTATRFADPY